MPRRGIFISLEGGEGVGKTTQITLLTKYFTDTVGVGCIQTREPGGSPYAEAIRRLILFHDEAKHADGMTMLLLFWAARADHLAKVVLPALSRGCNVITDRFDGATFAYQIFGQESYDLRELFFQIRQQVLKDNTPDLYVFLDIEPIVGLRRVALRKGEQQTHFDEREIAFHERVRKGCHAFKGMVPSITVNADQNEEAVHNEIVEKIKQKGFYI